MKKLEFKIIWLDQSDVDSVEIQINIANEKLSAHYTCYDSLERLKEIWQKELITKALTDRSQNFDMLGSMAGNVNIFIEKKDLTGKIAIKFDINFEEVKNDTQGEKCVIRLILDPAQLDSFCEMIQKMSGKVGESANIE